MANFGDVKSDQLQEYFYIPASTIFPFSGTATTPPTGFLFCNGTAVSRSTYSSLYDAIGTAYGAGNGSTTFNVPDLRGRVIAGRDMTDGSGTSARLSTFSSNGTALGAAGGSQTHTLGTAELPTHSHGIHVSDTGHGHGVTDPGHSHDVVSGQTIGGGSTYAVSWTTNWASAAGLGFTYPRLTGISVNTGNANISASLDASGGSASHNNLQPTMIVNYIIKT